MCIRDSYKYLHNLWEMQTVGMFLVAGILFVLAGIYMGARYASRRAIWFSGAGTVLTVLTLLLLAGWNHTAFYPSLADMQSSLTIRNASSSEFTLRVMSYVSLLVPVVVGYIWYAWRRLNRIRITREGLSGEEHTY